jgi:hypothetical protein
MGVIVGKEMGEWVKILRGFLENLVLQNSPQHSLFAILTDLIAYYSPPKAKKVSQ